MQIIPAQFGKSWQLVRQLFGNPFASAFAGNDRRQSTATQLPAMFGNLWHCLFFADLHYTFCRQTGVCQSCHNTSPPDARTVQIAKETPIVSITLFKLLTSSACCIFLHTAFHSLITSANMAPKAGEKKPAQPAKKAVAKKSSAGRKKGSKKAVESYKIYIYKVTVRQTLTLGLLFLFACCDCQLLSKFTLAE